MVHDKHNCKMRRTIISDLFVVACFACVLLQLLLAAFYVLNPIMLSSWHVNKMSHHLEMIFGPDTGSLSPRIHSGRVTQGQGCTLSVIR